MSKKQTAVEYLIQEIEQLITISTFQKWVDLKEKAKAMEKEQIEDAHYQGYRNFIVNQIKEFIDKENETYNK